GADLRVRAAGEREAGDVLLVRREVVARVVAALARRLAGGQQLVPGALGEAVGAGRLEQLARGAQVLAGIRPPALAAQPLAVQQVRAGELQAQARAPEALDRVAVVALGVTEQRPHTRFDAPQPVGARRERAV